MRYIPPSDLWTLRYILGNSLGCWCWWRSFLLFRFITYYGRCFISRIWGCRCPWRCRRLRLRSRLRRCCLFPGRCCWSLTWNCLRRHYHRFWGRLRLRNCRFDELFGSILLLCFLAILFSILPRSFPDSLPWIAWLNCLDRAPASMSWRER